MSLTGPAPRCTASSGQAAVSPAEGNWADLLLARDVRTASLLVLAATFVLATVSAAVTGAAGVLDRRRTYTLLRLSGTPLRVLHRARQAETLLPVALLGGGSIATGWLCGATLSQMDTGRPPPSPGLLLLVGSAAAGFLAVLGATAASRPLLDAVTRDPTSRT